MDRTWKFGELKAAGKAGEAVTDAVVVFVSTKDVLPLEFPAVFDRKQLETWRGWAASEGFKGKPGEVRSHRLAANVPASHAIVAGIGDSRRAGLEELRRAAGAAVMRARDLRAGRAAFLIPKGMKGGLPAGKGRGESAAEAVAEAVDLSLYKFDKYKSGSKDEDRFEGPSEIRLAGPASLGRAASRGRMLARAANLTRDLVNEPPGVMIPARMAEIAREIGGRPGFSVKIFGPGELKKMGAHAILGVGQGSHNPPALIHLSYRKAARPKRRVAFVGKGITFDSGGLCIKTADGMLTMKDDMAGAAAVLGIFSVLDELAPAVHVDGVFPAVENMPGGGAYRPGDVLKAMNGKTIEITNTDAEGRVVLADALSYISREKVDEVIDMATLTGAATIALGHLVSAVLSPDAGLVKRIRAAGESAGERFWELPLVEEYKENLRSAVADIKNSSLVREAGTILGGLFLKEFVDSKPWAHLDIAATCMTTKDKPLYPEGATGVGVRTALRYLAAV